MPAETYEESYQKLEELDLRERQRFIEGGLAGELPLLVDTIAQRVLDQGFSARFYVVYMTYLIERTTEKFMQELRSD